MALRFAFVLLLSVYSFNLGMAIPASPIAQICSPNAVFKTCGSACAPDCANPTPSDICTLQCVVGCFCNEGFLKNAKGECVRPQECETQIPQCAANEEFHACGTACLATCANPNPSPKCTKNCVIGCFCKPGYLKNAQGVCVAAANCDAPAQANIIPMQPQVCDDNEEFRQCKGCDGTCKNPNPLCPRICIPGCACKQGHLRSENDKCIETRECTAQHVQPESVATCGENEELRQCKGCDATCKNRHPICPHVCIEGCACKQGYVRSVTGKCVRPEGECTPELQPFEKKPVCGQNEVFKACGTACPAICANPHPSPVCTRNCVIGCFCQEGYLKNAQGVCVAAAKCDAPIQANETIHTSFERTMRRTSRMRT